MEEVRVSFIIVNWNGEDTISECLDSVASQTYTDHEVILIDNHSSDRSLDMARKNHRLDKVLALERNYGFAEANNKGLRQASGDYIALINNDTILEKDWLEKAMSVFQSSEHKNLASVATRIIQYHRRDVIDSAGVEYYGLGACWDYKNLPKNSPRVNKQRQVFGACAAAAVYKKDVIDRIGFFDPEYFIYFEDTDLAFRLRLYGYTCVYEPQAVCYHYGARRSDRKNKFFIEYGRRNIEFLFVKNMQGPLFLKYLLSHCVYESVLFFFYLSIGRAFSFLKAKTRALNQLGPLLRKRQKLKQDLIQRGRFQHLSETGQLFLRFRPWSLWNKFKKSMWTYQNYLNSE
ncbi:MAG: glycosyltransferase [Candidatus Aminicenantes bacterium]|nr:glycosyltransferase [Candidatus Aminicenantes bacterium]